RHVQAVDHVLPVLQPVAGNDRRAAAAEAGVVGLQRLALAELLEHVDARQQRLLLGRPEVGEHQAVALLEPIPGLADVVAELAALGLARLVEAAAVDREHPAVIAAAYALGLDPSVVEGCAAMSAARMHQAGTALAIAEQDQVLAEHAHLPRR